MYITFFTFTKYTQQNKLFTTEAEIHKQYYHPHQTVNLYI